MVQTHQKLPPDKYHDCFIDRTFLIEGDELSEKENEVRVKFLCHKLFLFSHRPFSFWEFALLLSFQMMSYKHFFHLIWK